MSSFLLSIKHSRLFVTPNLSRYKIVVQTIYTNYGNFQIILGYFHLIFSNISKGLRLQLQGYCYYASLLQIKSNIMQSNICSKRTFVFLTSSVLVIHSLERSQISENLKITGYLTLHLSTTIIWQLGIIYFGSLSSTMHWNIKAKTPQLTLTYCLKLT